MSALVWNTDIKSAPHGRYVVKQRKEGVDTRVFVPEWVILTTKCGKVTRSHYQPEVKRWLMLADGELPLAWMPWPEPYSNSLLAAPAVTDTSVATLLPATEGQSNHESDSPKSRPGDAAASLTQQSSSPRQERPSAQERSSDRSGGQFGDAPKPAHIPDAGAGVAQ